MAALYNAMKDDGPRKWFLRVAFFGLLFLMLLQVVRTIKPLNENVKYEKNAVEFVLGQIGASQKAYFGSGRMRYYASGDTARRKLDAPEVVKRILSEQIQPFDYVLLNVPVNSDEFNSHMPADSGYRVIKSYDNGTTRKVVVLQKSDLHN